MPASWSLVNTVSPLNPTNVRFLHLLAGKIRQIHQQEKSLFESRSKNHWHKEHNETISLRKLHMFVQWIRKPNSIRSGTLPTLISIAQTTVRAKRDYQRSHRRRASSCNDQNSTDVIDMTRTEECWRHNDQSSWNRLQWCINRCAFSLK